jgi:hypothetical protein
MKSEQKDGGHSPTILNALLSVPKENETEIEYASEGEVATDVEPEAVEFISEERSKFSVLFELIVDFQFKQSLQEKWKIQ